MQKRKTKIPTKMKNTFFLQKRDSVTQKILRLNPLLARKENLSSDIE